MVHAIERVDLPRDVGALLMQHFMRAAEALKNRAQVDS
jgi:hemoglobin